VKRIEQYVDDSIYPEINKIVIDPIQNSKLGLIIMSGNNPNLELIEPINNKSTTYNYLKKTGGGYHHICFEIETNNELENYFKRYKIKKIYGPVNAILFDNKPSGFWIYKE